MDFLFFNLFGHAVRKFSVKSQDQNFELKIQNGCQNSHQNIKNIENAIISLFILFIFYI